MLKNISSFFSTALGDWVIPWWLKYLAVAMLLAAVWTHGYVKGLANGYKDVANETIKVVYKQGKVTTKIVNHYIKVKEKQVVVDEQIKKEGQSYAIQFPNDSYTFNNEYVRLFNQSVTGNISTLSSGTDGESSGVTVSRQLDVSINNNTVARDWKLRAETCENWTKAQEEASNK